MLEMHKPVIYSKSGDQVLQEVSSGKSHIGRDINCPSHPPDFWENDTPPSSPLPKVAASNPLFFNFDKAISKMDSSNNVTSSLALPAKSQTSLLPPSSLATPPNTPTFVPHTSHPLQIPSLCHPMSGVLTPPDTPTSPFGSMMKHVLTSRPPTIQDVSFFAATAFASPKASSSSVTEMKEENLFQATKDAVLVSGDLHQVEEKKGDEKKHRPKLRINTKIGVHIPLSHIEWPVPEPLGHKAEDKGEREERGEIEEKEKREDKGEMEEKGEVEVKEETEEEGEMQEKEEMEEKEEREEKEEVEEKEVREEKVEMEEKGEIKKKKEKGQMEEKEEKREMEENREREETEEEEKGREVVNHVQEVLPEEKQEEEEDDKREPMVLCFIGSDLRKIADQFQATYAKVDRILRNGSLNLTVSTAITGCLSVSLFCLSVGETSAELP